MSTQWKTGSGSFNGLSVESAQFILDIGKFCNWISFFLADGQHLSFWHTCFWLFEFKISDIWQQLSYRTKLRTTGLMALPLAMEFTFSSQQANPLWYNVRFAIYTLLWTGIMYDQVPQNLTPTFFLKDSSIIFTSFCSQASYIPQK